MIRLGIWQRVVQLPGFVAEQDQDVRVVFGDMRAMTHADQGRK